MHLQLQLERGPLYFCVVPSTTKGAPPYAAADLWRGSFRRGSGGPWGPFVPYEAAAPQNPCKKLPVAACALAALRPLGGPPLLSPYMPPGAASYGGPL